MSLCVLGRIRDRMKGIAERVALVRLSVGIARELNDRLEHEKTAQGMSYRVMSPISIG